MAPVQMRNCKDVQPDNHKMYVGGDLLQKITGQLYIRAEHETEYRRWDDLSKEEMEKISECLNREAAKAGGFHEAA